MDIKTLKGILKKAKKGTMTRAEYNAVLLEWIAEKKAEVKEKREWYEKRNDKQEFAYFDTIYTDLCLIECDIKNGLEKDFAEVLLELYPEYFNEL